MLTALKSSKKNQGNENDSSDVPTDNEAKLDYSEFLPKTRDVKSHICGVDNRETAVAQ